MQLKSTFTRDYLVIYLCVQVTTFADMEGEETFDSSFLGQADEVVEERIAADDVIMVKGTKNTSAVSIFGYILFFLKSFNLFNGIFFIIVLRKINISGLIDP